MLLNLLNANKVSKDTSGYQIRFFKLERQAFTVDECLLFKESVLVILVSAVPRTVPGT